MPTYEYACNECGHRFEEFQRISADPISICPKCNGSVKRLISAGNGLIFKGSGFYITDYKHKSNGTTDASSKSPSGDKTKSDTKAEDTKSPTSDQKD